MDRTAKHNRKEIIRLSLYPQNELAQRFDIWFEEEMPRLFRYICYRTRDRCSAEEIISIICEKALTKIGQYDPSRGEMRLWLFGIARNELRGYYRTLTQHPSPISLDSLPDFTFQTHSPEEEYQKKEAFMQVLRVLGTLPEREQEIIALRYGASLTTQEISRLLGLKGNHVDILIHRTLNKLKQSQKEEYDVN
jgi:RNA polymerase sigma-70 factor (ECF subfamily)